MKKIYLIDYDSQTMKDLLLSKFKISFIPIIDFFVMWGLICGGTAFVCETYLKCEFTGWKFGLFISLVWLIFTLIKGYIEFFQLLNLSKKIAIIKSSNTITIIKVKNSNFNGQSEIIFGNILFNNQNGSNIDKLLGIFSFALGIRKIGNNSKDNNKFLENQQKIEDIFTNRSSDFKYTDYMNSKLILQTKKYYLFEGNKNNSNQKSKFKIYKTYTNINSIEKYLN